jgi:hypothetical protein
VRLSVIVLIDENIVGPIASLERYWALESIRKHSDLSKPAYMINVKTKENTL